MFRDYGNGEIGDDGIHDLDMAAWGLGIDTLPEADHRTRRPNVLRGHDSEYPDNLNVTYEYPDGRLLVYENYPFTAYGLHGFDDGNVFYGTEGYMVFSRRGAFSVFLGPKCKPGPTEGENCAARPAIPNTWPTSSTPSATARRPAPRPRSRTAAVPWSTWARSPTARAGRLDFDPETGRFADCEEANATPREALP